MKKIVQLLFFIPMMLLMTGCHANYLDMAGQLEVTVLKLDTGYYFSPTWMSNGKIVFNYAASMDYASQDTIVPTLRIYDINEKTWSDISVSNSDNCYILNYLFLQELPNHHLGFLSTCLPRDSDVFYKIQSINIITGDTKVLVATEFRGAPGTFTFSPDMAEMVQENSIGKYLSNQLFYNKGETWIRILPNFTRAMFPDWSPLYREIAFWGTEAYPGGNPDDFKTLPQILNLSIYPWDLYVSTPNGEDSQKILSSVSDPYKIKWSPNEKTIAFSGTYANSPGVWIINPTTHELTRIWSKRADFDWSPDGNSIVILDQETDEIGKILKQDVSIITLK